MRTNPRHGFTLIEILVIAGIMAVVSSVMMTYGSSSRQQVNLATETAKLAQIIARAKAMAISSYVESSVCGYGIGFDYANNLYYLASYQLSNCGGNSSITSKTIMETFKMSIGVNISSNVPGNQMNDLIFVPPDPLIYTSDTSDNLFINRGASVKLITSDSVASRNISVNPFGQITF